MLKRLAALESGRCRVADDRGRGWVDVTQEAISRLRLHIAELDEILAERDAERSAAGATPGSSSAEAGVIHPPRFQ